MSGIPELIKINRNIEKQNEEIIRLLKKIAGEDTAPKRKLSQRDSKNIGVDVSVTESGKVTISQTPQDVENHEMTVPEDSILEHTGEVGVVYFIDDGDIYRLSVKNNETVIDNLTGDGETTNFNEQEIVANESVSKNQSLPDSTVILNTQQSAKLPETLRMCYELGAKKVYLPWSSMTQLVGAPDMLMKVLKLDFYRSDEELIGKVFG